MQALSLLDIDEHLNHPVEAGRRQAYEARIGRAQLEDEENRAANGDRAREMREDGDHIRRRHKAVAEKQRRGPTDDHAHHIRRKRIGELARHQHIGFSELLGEIRAEVSNCRWRSLGG